MVDIVVKNKEVKVTSEPEQGIKVAVKIPEIKVEIGKPDFKVIVEDGKVLVVPNDDED